MLIFKNIGELAIPSEMNSSIEWKISKMRNIIDYGIKCTLESPPFLYKNKILKTILIIKPKQDCLMIQVVRADDTSCVTHFLHRRGIKEISSYNHVTDFKDSKGLYFWDLLDIKNAYLIAGYMTVFVQFSTADNNVDSEVPLPSIPVERSKSSLPSLQKSGHVKGQDTLIENLKELYLNEVHSDFTITVRDRKFKTHKAILASQSKVFTAMLKHDMTEKDTNEMCINDCDPDAFQEFLLYLYSGKADALSNLSVVAVYTIADKYGVEALKQECVNYMKNNLSVDMFCDFIEFALQWEETELLNLSKEYFTIHAKPILLSINWQSFSKQNEALAHELVLLKIESS